MPASAWSPLWCSNGGVSNFGTAKRGGYVTFRGRVQVFPPPHVNNEHPLTVEHNFATVFLENTRRKKNLCITHNATSPCSKVHFFMLFHYTQVYIPKWHTLIKVLPPIKFFCYLLITDFENHRASSAIGSSERKYLNECTPFGYVRLCTVHMWPEVHHFSYNNMCLTKDHAFIGSSVVEGI